MSVRNLDGTRSLDTVEPGRRARIVAMGNGDPRRMVRLSDLGLVPGATVRMLYRRPATVVSCAGTTVALERDIAATIRVAPVD